MNDTRPIPCSVGVLTFNNEATLPRALESVKAFSDIIVCDGGSSDRTRDIAEQFGARVIDQDAQFKNQNGTIADFAGVRNQTLTAATHDWFLYLDSDEYLSPDVVEEIRAVVEAPESTTAPIAYRLPRKTVVQGVCIECATAYPNYQTRLFRKSASKGFVKRVHERPSLPKNAHIGTLTHPEYVPLNLTEEEMKNKQRYYLSIEVERHKDETFWQWLLGPVADSLRSSLSYLVRHVRILLFCRGVRMPLWVEFMHHWYNWELIRQTGAKFFTSRKQESAG